MTRWNSDPENDEPVEIGEYECAHETDKAILLKEDLTDEKELWVPKSVLVESAVNEKGDRGTVSVKRWWATKEQLI